VNSFFPHCDKCRVHSTLPSRIKNDSYSNKTERRIITSSTNQRSYTSLFQSLRKFLLSLAFRWGYEISHAVNTRLTLINSSSYSQRECPFHARLPTRLLCYRHFTREVTVGVSSNSVFPETLLLADPLLVSKNNHGSTHLCSRKCSIPGLWVSKIEKL